MEIDSLVTQDLSDAGTWHPITLYGKPADFDLLILGDDSDVVQQYGRKSMKKLKGMITKETQTKDEEYSDETIDELSDSTDENVLVRIVGIRGWKVERKGSKEVSREPEHVILCDTELKNDKQSYKLLIQKIPAIKDIVLKISRDRTNFLSGKSRN